MAIAMALASASAPLFASDAGSAPVRTVVILSASSAAGTGATTYDSAYSGRFATYLSGLKPAWKLVNLAVGGYTCYQIMPTGYQTPPNRPAVDTAHNITKALSLKPDRILISMIGNDIGSGYGETEIQNNLDSLYGWATKAGIPTWVADAPPRNSDDSAKVKIRLHMRQWIMDRYAPHGLDFYDSLGDANGKYFPDLDAGDGTHYNNKAHAIVFRKLVAANIPGLPTIALLGASAALGYGASTADSGYAGRYGKYLSGLDPTWRLASLAVDGHTSYQIMPTGYVPPANRPAPDTTHNISKVLALKPECLILSMAGSDVAYGYSESEIKANLDSLYGWATKAGIRTWVATPQPRTPDDSTQRKIRQDMRQWILSRYAPRVLDFYTDLGGYEGNMYPEFNSGDGSHYNDKGYPIVYRRLVAANLTDLTTVAVREMKQPQNGGSARASALRMDRAFGPLLLPGPDGGRFDARGRKAMAPKAAP